MSASGFFYAAKHVHTTLRTTLLFGRKTLKTKQLQCKSQFIRLFSEMIEPKEPRRTVAWDYFLYK